ncbi:TRAM domain-containing protein [Halobaculum sp. D14]|uniref:TRAM domain-containing protein n=1 Tax=Halobaculum sp. D14 TaxID=3421642 RepID=UPI003EC0F3C3
MVDISDSLRLLYEAPLEADGDRYVVPIPSDLVENGSLSDGEMYRVALLPSAAEKPNEDGDADAGDAEAEPEQDDSTEPQRSAPPRRTQDAPVEEGETRSVTIDTLGDQGDGIAKVERGFIVIVPGTQPGDQVDVEITDVKDTVAFAEPVSEPTVR